MDSLAVELVFCEGTTVYIKLNQLRTYYVISYIIYFGYLVQCGILPEITKNIHRGNKFFIIEVIF
jgi:hypothetical protein